MHITFSFDIDGDSTIRLPSANLHLFQSMLYSLLPDEIAGKIHDEGFDSDGRKMKLFSFGWPVAESRPQFGKGTIIFPLPIKLTLSTPLSELAAGFSSGALIKNDIRIGNNHLICTKIEKQEQKVNSDSILIQTLSPITCYESIDKDGKNFTRYFSPYDDEFQTGIYFNLTRKFKLLYPDREIKNENFKIIPKGQIKERVSMFEKGGAFPIKGWWGKFLLKGDKDILQTAVDCGLGSKNSSGWGCVTIFRN